MLLKILVICDHGSVLLLIQPVSQLLLAELLVSLQTSKCTKCNQSLPLLRAIPIGNCCTFRLTHAHSFRQHQFCLFDWVRPSLLRLSYPPFLHDLSSFADGQACTGKPMRGAKSQIGVCLYCIFFLPFSCDGSSTFFAKLILFLNVSHAHFRSLVPRSTLSFDSTTRRPRDTLLSCGCAVGPFHNLSVSLLTKWDLLRQNPRPAWYGVAIRTTPTKTKPC